MGFGGGAILLAGLILFAAMVAFSPGKPEPTELKGLDRCDEGIQCRFTSVSEGSALEGVAVRTVNFGQNVLVACVDGRHYEGQGFVAENDCKCNMIAKRCMIVPRGMVPRVSE